MLDYDSRYYMAVMKVYSRCDATCIGRIKVHATLPVAVLFVGDVIILLAKV